jgi:hypothetical protein
MIAVFHFFRKFGVRLLVLVFVASFIAAFLSGYRLAPGFTIVKNGVLTIAGLPDGSTVFFDSATIMYSKNGSVRIGLLPGTHTVIADTPNNQPWNEVVTIAESGTTTLTPILVPVNIRARALAGEELARAQNLIGADVLPISKKPLSLGGGCVSVYTQGNQIIAEATTSPASSDCAPPSFLCEAEVCAPTIIYITADTLRSVMPLPGRQDALVVVSGGLMFALELDPREPQFFAPLFKGAFIRGTTFSTTSIAGTDGTKTFEIPFTINEVP